MVYKIPLPDDKLPELLTRLLRERNRLLSFVFDSVEEMELFHSDRVELEDFIADIQPEIKKTDCLIKDVINTS